MKNGEEGENMEGREGMEEEDDDGFERDGKSENMD